VDATPAPWMRMFEAPATSSAAPPKRALALVKA